MIANEIALAGKFAGSVQYCLHGNQAGFKEEALARAFEDNISYTLEGHQHLRNPDKCGWFESRNLLTDDPETCIKVMAATAARSRAESSCYHFSIDWHADEQDKLDRSKATQAADAALDKLGLSEHQAMYFWHVDADHPHMHIVVNRVHELTGKAHDMWKSKERLEIATHEVARDMGFEQVPGRHNDLSDDFQPDRNKGKPTSKEERANGDGLSPWVKEDIQQIKDTFRSCLHETDNWQELSDNLKSSGLQMRGKGQGIVITDGKKYAKLSQMGKDIRLKGEDGLEVRFGQSFAEFEQQQAVSEKESEEDLINWIEEADRVTDLPDAARDNSQKLSELMNAIERLEDFEWARTVQKSSDQYLKAVSKVKRQEWLLEHARSLLERHNTYLNDMLVNIYREPEQAKQAVSELYSDGKLREAVKQSGLEKERWKVWLDIAKRKKRHIAKKLGKKNSKERKRANKLERKLYYRFQKIREAENRIKDRENQLTEAKFSLQHKKKQHKENKEKRTRMQRIREAAAQDVTRNMIYKSDVPWREKTKMLKAVTSRQREEKRNRTRTEELER